MSPHATLLALALLPIWLAAQTPPPPAASQPAGPEFKLLVPAEGQKYSGHVVVYGEFPKAPERPIRVRVQGLDVVHHFVFLPTDRRYIRPGRGYEFRDHYLPCREGSHAVDVSAWYDDAPALVVTRRAQFTITQPAGPAEQETTTARNRPGQAQSLITTAERRLEVYLEAVRARTCSEERVQKGRDELASLLVNEVFERLNALSDLAWLYASALDRDRALACLEIARAAHDATPATLSHPLLPAPVHWKATTWRSSAPAFLQSFADLCARFGHLDQAVAWQERQAQWYRDRAADPALDAKDRGMAVRYEAGCYQSMAFYHLLLRNDQAAHQQWTAKAAEVQKKAP